MNYIRYINTHFQTSVFSATVISTSYAQISSSAFLTIINLMTHQKKTLLTATFDYTEPHSNIFRSSDFVNTVFQPLILFMQKNFERPHKARGYIKVILASFYKITVYLQIKLKRYKKFIFL